MAAVSRPGEEGEIAPATEELVVCRDAGSGLVAVIAVDDTSAGPAVGGIRMRRYASEEAAISECRRLARIMTLKCGLAEVGFGGGKSVIIESDEITDRVAALRAFARFVARTGGAYIPAADLGTGSEDLRIVGEAGPRVFDFDTSVATAVGVHAAIESGVSELGLAASLDGVTVVVQGVGHVGAHLAELLAADGAKVAVCDADAARAAAVAERIGGSVLATRDAVSAECDVFAPCAVARVLDDDAVGTLKARLVAGAANDILDHPGVAEALVAAEITCVPDFVANAGGVIQARASTDGWDDERLRRELRAIGPRVAAILTEARRTGETPQAVAERLALASIERLRPAAADGRLPLQARQR